LIYQWVAEPKIEPGVGLGSALLVFAGVVALADAVGFGSAATLVVSLGPLAGAPVVQEDNMRAAANTATAPTSHLLLAPRRLLSINLVPLLLSSNGSAEYIIDAVAYCATPAIQHARA
jgi:hypothetical protein